MLVKFKWEGQVIKEAHMEVIPDITDGVIIDDEVYTVHRRLFSTEKPAVMIICRKQ